MNDPDRVAGAALFTAGRDPDCDAQLLHRIGQGDEEAMGAFYRGHGRVVLSQVLLVTGERPLAEEITQDTMLAVWHGARSFRGDSSVRSWVIAIARRQTRDRLRGRRLRVVDDAFLADQPDSGPGPEVTALDRAKAHLAGCEHCRLEAKRWDLVADGVRDLMASVPETAPPTPPAEPAPLAGSAPPALPTPPTTLRRTGRHLLAGPRRRATLATAAAAALVLGGGLTVALSSHAPAPGPTPRRPSPWSTGAPSSSRPPGHSSG